MPKKSTSKTIQTFTHKGDLRKNIPTAEYQSIVPPDIQQPVMTTYERNRDLDPQLMWRGKDEQDWSDLVVAAPPLYIQEKVHPKVLIDDLVHQTRAEKLATQLQLELFSDFNGIPSGDARTEFYQHDGNWTNRMILGDSLQVMASLAEREGLRGRVQCIYLDPPYGIKFNSNFQWSTTSRDVKDGNAGHITREPEQVKAFRDTWRDGIHSYLTYLRDRLIVARDLLSESGSMFVQIGDENVHVVRCLLDEVFGTENFVAQISFQKTGGIESKLLASTVDYVVWFAKHKDRVKYRPLYDVRKVGLASLDRYDMLLLSDQTVRRASATEIRSNSFPVDSRRYQLAPLYSEGASSQDQEFEFLGKKYLPRRDTHWKTAPYPNLKRLERANRIEAMGSVVRYRRFVDDFPVIPIGDRWDSMQIGVQRYYVVQTSTSVVERCVLMATDPGDLVLDPTCGSGTTAYVAEQWARRWITIDTSRVALALSRARIMGARYPFYVLKDSSEGIIREAELNQRAPANTETFNKVRHGFVYERVPHITLKSIATNGEIDVIWDKWFPVIQGTLQELNGQLREHRIQFKVTIGGRAGEIIDFAVPWAYSAVSTGEQALSDGLLEWEVPRKPPGDWPAEASQALEAFWNACGARQKEIDASITTRAVVEGFQSLYDRPFEDKGKVRVSGPFTVESLSPHRVSLVDENDELIDPLHSNSLGSGNHDFISIILENLKTAGVQQAHKEDKIQFSTLTPWPGELICAEGRYEELNTERRAAIFIGPEFGTVSRPDLVSAAREAVDAGFDVLIACAFNYDAHSSEFSKLGRIPVLKARMNADLHMAGDLKNTGAGNLFVIFGEPDIEILPCDGDQVQVKIHGVDVFDPQSGEVRSDGADGIACWFIDTNYNEESFFVRHAYFLGANDPYRSLKTTLKAEVSAEAWDSLYSDVSRPFSRPETGRISVKVINHLGDEVMKVFRVPEHVGS